MPGRSGEKSVHELLNIQIKYQRDGILYRIDKMFILSL